jgi:hypothetical protein
MAANDKPHLLVNRSSIPKPSGFQNILKIFEENVLEVVFKRRIKPQKKVVGHLRPTRRMLCTSNWKLINSPLTKDLFNWKGNPKSERGYYWYKNRNLVIVWSLTDLDWRMVNLNEWEVVAYIPVSNLLQKTEFIEFYRESIERMSDYKKKSIADQ